MIASTLPPVTRCRQVGVTPQTVAMVSTVAQPSPSAEGEADTSQAGVGDVRRRGRMNQEMGSGGGQEGIRNTLACLKLSQRERDTEG